MQTTAVYACVRILTETLANLEEVFIFEDEEVK
jgi:phage portal protein BeeE